MSWLSNFFKRDAVKAFLKLGEKLLKILIGGIAENLQAVAQQEVYKAEITGATGLDKYEQAFKGIRARFPELRESSINLAIEIAVSAIQAHKK